MSKPTLRCFPPWDGTLKDMGEHGDACWFAEEPRVVRRDGGKVCLFDGMKAYRAPCRNIEKVREVLRLLGPAVGLKIEDDVP